MTEKIGEINHEEWEFRTNSSYFSSVYLLLEKRKDGFEVKPQNQDSYENIPWVTIKDSYGNNLLFPIKLESLPKITYFNSMRWQMTFSLKWQEFIVQYKINARFPEMVNAFKNLSVNDALWNKISLEYKLLDSGLLIFLPDWSWLILSNDSLKKALSGKMRADSWIYTFFCDGKSISIRINPIAVFNKNQFTIFLDDNRVVDNRWNFKTYFQNDIIPAEYLKYTVNGIILVIPWGKNILFDRNWNIVDGQKLSVNFIEAGFMRLFAKHGLYFLSEITAGSYEIKVDQKAKSIHIKKTPN
jgi:hypothetical protein